MPVDSNAGSGETGAGPEKANVPRRRRLRLVLATVLVIVALTGFFAAAFTFHFFGFGIPDCSSHPTNALNSVYFVVLMDNRGMNAGFNGSQYHSGLWPIMNVTLGKSVTIHVWNVDPVEAHGFAITRYFLPTLTLNSGGCFDVRFVADKLGPFQVYCWIPCSIHQFMQNGVLNVNPVS